MVEVESAIPNFKFIDDQWAVIGWIYDRLLDSGSFGNRTISWLENRKKGSIISACEFYWERFSVEMRRV